MIKWLKKKLNRKAYEADRWEHYKMLVARDLKNIDKTGIIHQAIKRIEKKEQWCMDEAVIEIEQAVVKSYKEYDKKNAKWEDLKEWVDQSKYVDIPVKWIIEKMRELER